MILVAAKLIMVETREMDNNITFWYHYLIHFLKIANNIDRGYHWSNYYCCSDRIGIVDFKPLNYCMLIWLEVCNKS